MIQKLSSLKLAFYNLVFLIALLGTGLYLSRAYQHSFQMMNESLLYDWLKASWKQEPALTVWFGLVCISSGLLFINAVCCTLTRQIQVAVNSVRFEKWLFFVLHCLFVGVLVCHGLALVVGSKKANIPVSAGDCIQFETDYTIEISDIVFVDDRAILKAGKKEQRALMTRQSIHRHQNFVQVSLYHQSELLAAGNIFMLSPLRYKSIQVTLINFVYRENDRPGVILTLTRNYLNPFFFTIYGLMILTLGAYGVLIFRNEHR